MTFQTKKNMRHLVELFLFFVVLMALPDWYIYRTYIRRLPKMWMRRLYWLPSLLLLIGMVITFGTYEPRPEAMSRLSLLLIVFLCINVPKALFALLAMTFRALAGKIHHEFYESYLALAIALFSGSVILFGATEGKQHFEVKEVEIRSKDLPEAFDGYRIVQFSDMHVGTFRDGNEEDVQTIVNLINEQHCDAIFFTGDLVNHQSSELDGFRRDLSKLQAPDGVYAVMGNHDYSMYLRYPDEKDRHADVKELQRRVRSYGWTLLLNEHRILRRGSDSLVIAGVENDGRPPFPSLGNLPKTMKGLKRSCFTILLSHDPTAWQRKIVPQTNIQLTLSGHTHAGQFKMFGWSPVSHVYDEWSGAYTQGNQILNISDGIGAVMFPFRFGAWPEINVITLRKANSKQKPTRQ